MTFLIHFKFADVISGPLPEADFVVPHENGEGAGIEAGVTKEMLFQEINFLRSERDTARKQLEDLQTKMDKVRLSVALIKQNDSKCIYYIGISWNTFSTVFNFLQKDMPPNGIPLIPLMDQFFFTIVKLKHNPKFEYLADQAGVSHSTMIDYFWKWVNRFYTKLNFLLSWPEDGASIEQPPQSSNQNIPK